MLKMEKAFLVELIRKPVHILHEAAKVGHVEMIMMLTRTCPQLIWDTDSNGYTIFHIAVAYRQRRVFHLAHQIDAMLGFTATWQDRKGNNILHLAAAESLSLNETKLPPAPQFQRELLWFQVR